MAALSRGVIIDTSDQSDPFTLTDATGAQREFLIVEDGVAGAQGTGQCPNGGVHVYDITGDNERSPVKVGYWNIDEVRPTTSPTHSCTAHVFDIHEAAKVMTIAYYNGSTTQSASDGAWLTPAQALARAKLRPKVALTPSTAFFCLLSE